ncbi:MAG: response regulator transcription factor [Chloroflexi bacterium]|nr:response regulator transcription factor [Chloroflexota bacterium]MCI0578607.1 response regulator transcription factor [Chloroflexota bacterium]MCI0647366.1 response regulator transcription factor [Chloroflexota bacterium]MCI0727826.1 response regulator transcription factor [Chloroflexota bacterium]
MTKKIKVLIVDDHHETRENLYRMLELDNELEAVAHASTGVQALDMARLYEPDVVLMDVHMPGVDGVAASQAILRAVPQTKIIMMSGQSDTDYQWGSMLVGASEFLTKPFTAKELVNCIRSVCAV